MITLALVSKPGQTWTSAMGLLTESNLKTKGGCFSVSKNTVANGRNDIWQQISALCYMLLKNCIFVDFLNSGLAESKRGEWTREEAAKCVSASHSGREITVWWFFLCNCELVTLENNIMQTKLVYLTILPKNGTGEINPLVGRSSD